MKKVIYDNRQKAVKCCNCKRNFTAGTTHGLPNGVGFVKGDKTYNICQTCLVNIGAMTKEERDAHLRKILGE